MHEKETEKDQNFVKNKPTNKHNLQNKIGTLKFGTLMSASYYIFSKKGEKEKEKEKHLIPSLKWEFL